MIRNIHRVFQRISPTWDMDLHIHSNWSQDNLNGPYMADYIPFAERYKIHIGFADHYELLYYEPNKIPLKPGKWRLNPDTLDKYLEEIDTLKSRYSCVSSGLEIDYYSSRKDKLRDFVDNYRDQFDLLIGSVHEIEDYRPITIKSDLDWLLEKYGNLEVLTKKYFNIIKDLLEEKIFDVVAHPDVIYRFYSQKELSKQAKVELEPTLIEIGKLCLSTKTIMEVNISGLRYPWQQSFPPESMIRTLLASGNEFIVGSDSHSTSDFEKSILDIRKYNRLIKP